MFAKKNTAALNCHLVGLRPANGANAKAIARGHFAFSSSTEMTGDYLPFSFDSPSVAWQNELHGFSWLRHFSQGVKEGDKDLAALARYYVGAWGEMNHHNKIAWNLSTSAERVISWLTNGEILTENLEDKKWQQTMRAWLILHGKFLLRRAASRKYNDDGRLSAGVALVLLGLCLNGYDHWIEKGFLIVMNETSEQILPDGGHITRNPSQHLKILFDLLTLKKNLLAQGRPAPDKLPAVIDRMLPMLRFFIHGDGSLALFNGGKEEEKDILQAALANDDAGGKPFQFAPHSAYQRLSSGSSLLLMDTGTPPPHRFSQKAHAGCLSMEMSVGKQRFIVNCGSPETLDENWQNAARSTAAHSTLTLQNTSSARKTRFNRLFGKHLSGLNQAFSHRNENAQGISLDAGHDGYVKNFGLTHRRKLFLAKGGKSLHGEDLLQLSGRRNQKHQGTKRFALRFHLHPKVRAGLADKGSKLIARLPNGEGWLLRAEAQTIAGSPIQICPLQKQDSVYLGGAKPRRAEQVVIEAHTAPSTDAETVAKVNWVWQKIEKEV